ncbi:MAG: response regulator [bacterium]|nr:response regulator [bacterium]
MQHLPSTPPASLRRLKHYQQPLLVFLAGLLLSFVLSLWVTRQVDAQVEGRFQSLVQRQVERIRDRFELFPHGLKGTRGIFLENPSAVNAGQFLRYVESRDLIREFPGALAWSYIERIPAHAVPAALKRLPGYHRLDDLPQPPAGQEAWVVRLVEPENSAMLLGLDIASEARRHAAAAAAMQTGKVTLSAPITLLQDRSADLQGFLMLLPVHKGAAEAANVVGWIEVALRIEEVLRFLASEPGLASAVDISISDVTARPEQLYRLPHNDTTPPQQARPGLSSVPKLQEKRRLEIAGRLWEVQMSARPGLYTSADRLLPPVILALGCLLSLMVAGLLALSATLRLRAEEKALAMTASLREREELLQSTLSSLNDWVFVLDTQGVVLDCHEPGEGSWQSSSDFINRSLASSLPADAAADLDNCLQQVQRDGHARFEFELKDHAPARHFMARLSARKGSDGHFDGITVVAHDISNERARARELHESEEKFRLLFAEAAQAIMLTRQTQYVDANPAALRLFGVPNLVALQHANLGVVSPLMQPDGQLSREALKHIMRRAADEGPQHFEWTFQRLSDGETFPSEVHCSLITINGEPHFLSLVTDLSAHKQVEHTLIQSRDEAEAATREKSDFLATMSHEIRTPMNGVLGMAQLLANTNLDPEQREYLTTIQQSGQSLLTIINDILDFSKLEAGKLSFEEIPFDLQVAIDETCELLLPQIREKNLSLQLELAPGTPFQVIGDPGRFRQILLNYLSNALKFTQKGGITVGLRTRESGRGAALYELSVADTGIGISAEKQEVLFQRFAQADTTTTRRFGGTGLGLAICKALVERMGGTVSMTSNPGHGSTFRATFWMSLDPNSSHQLMPVMSPALRNIPVLLVDAATRSRELLAQGLSKFGLSVVCAGSVAEATGLAREHKPGFVLLDDELPDGDAESLLQALRHEGGLNDARMLLLSSRPVRNDHEFLRTQKIAAYLPKPARLMWILSCLNILASGEHDGVVTRHTLSTHHSRGKALPGLRSGIRVLLAEDNAVNQKVAARMLEKMGCHVDLVGNGLEALVMVSQLPYDVVLMDVQMPEMDGITATRNLRAQGFATIPIIALTANNRESDRQECRAVGMSDFLAKPIRYEDLHACLSRWV